MRIGMPAAFAARDDELDLVGAADVAGVDPDGGDALLDRLQRQAGVEVDVGDHRDRREADDPAERLGVLGLRDGDADDLAAGGGERGDLRGRGGDVVRLRQSSSTARRPARRRRSGRRRRLTLSLLAAIPEPSV